MNELVRTRECIDGPLDDQLSPPTDVAGRLSAAGFVDFVENRRNLQVGADFNLFDDHRAPGRRCNLQAVKGGIVGFIAPTNVRHNWQRSPQATGHPSPGRAGNAQHGGYCRNPVRETAAAVEHSAPALASAAAAEGLAKGCAVQAASGGDAVVGSALRTARHAAAEREVGEGLFRVEAARLVQLGRAKVGEAHLHQTVDGSDAEAVAVADVLDGSGERLAGSVGGGGRSLVGDDLAGVGERRTGGEGESGEEQGAHGACLAPRSPQDEAAAAIGRALRTLTGEARAAFLRLLADEALSRLAREFGPAAALEFVRHDLVGDLERLASLDGEGGS